MEGGVGVRDQFQHGHDEKPSKNKAFSATILFLLLLRSRVELVLVDHSQEERSLGEVLAEHDACYQPQQSVIVSHEFNPAVEHDQHNIPE